MLYLTVVTVLFAVTLAYVEIIRLHSTDPGQASISDYLTGPASLVEDIGFVIMAVALWYTAVIVAEPWTSISMAFVGIGLCGAMLTDRFSAFFGPNHEKFHLSSAGVCFVAGFSLMLSVDQSIGMYALTGAYLAVAGATRAMIPKDGAVDEKLAVLLLVIFVLAYSLGGR